MSETFAQRLSRLRRERGLSKVKLAERAGVTEAAIRSWETGRTAGPSFAVGLRIARALRENPVVLAFGVDEATFAASLEGG